jgi:hypothetical protein
MSRSISSPLGHTLSPVDRPELSGQVPPLCSQLLPSPAHARGPLGGCSCSCCAPRRGPRGCAPSALTELPGSPDLRRPRSPSARARAAARVVATPAPHPGAASSPLAGQSAPSLSSPPEASPRPALPRPGRSPRARRLADVGYGRAARFFGRGGGTASWLPAFSNFKKYFCAWLRTCATRGGSQQRAPGPSDNAPGGAPAARPPRAAAGSPAAARAAPASHAGRGARGGQCG